MNEERCVHETVAQSPHCSVARCEGCGGFVLTVGPVSVRLPAHVLAELMQCLGNLERNSARADEVSASPRTRH